MKRYLLVSLLCLHFCKVGFSQNLYLGDLTLKTQEEVNIFSSGKYEEIQGSLSIEFIFEYSSYRDPITSLSGLSHLKKISGSLNITPSSFLTDLDGLENITSIKGNLTISRTNLTSMKGLNGLEEVTGYLTIKQNLYLTSLQGLESLSKVRDILISNNHQIEEIKSFKSLIHVDESIFIRNNKNLKTINSFENLSSISYIIIGENDELTRISSFPKVRTSIDDLEIFNNPKLTNLPSIPLIDSIMFNLKIDRNGSLIDLKSLSNITYVRTLRLSQNNSLTSLQGLDQLIKIGYLYIYDNLNLSTCCLPIDFREMVTNYIGISDNAPGCQSIDDILANCSYQSICDFYSIPEWSETAFNALCEMDLFADIPERFRSASNKITRAELATIIFNSIGLTDDNNLATNFPSPYGDLQNPKDWFYKYAKNLLYLEYGDGHSPFDRNRFNFQPDSSITKAHAIKVLLEAWNISPEDGDLPFTDVDSNHEVYGYLVSAYNNHVFNDSPYEGLLNPNDAITWAEISLFTYNLIQEKGTPEITEEDFFVPGNITPLTLSSPPSISEGYFDYSGGISFAIPSVGLPLVFGHSYNSFYHELPKELNTGVNNSQTPIKPLGAGWSHSFNSYMLRLEEQDGNERWAIVWPDGAYHFYNQSGNGYKSQTLGVYDTLLQENEDRFQLITKGQTTYTFERISGSLEAFPFVLTSIKDRNNNSIRIIYSLSENNGWYRISEVIGTKGRKLTFSYWAGSDLVSTITDPAGRLVKFEYDSKSNSRANLIKFTDVKGNIETYEYTEISGFNFLANISFPDGNQILNEYDPLLRKLISTENKYANSKLTFTHHFNYSETDGDFYASDFLDENNLNYRTGRNIAGRVNQLNTPLGTIETNYNQDSPILPTSIVGIDKIEASYTYDQHANVTRIELPEGITHNFSYNERNDVTSYSDPLGNTALYEYDERGNLSSITTAEGGKTTFEHLNNGLLKSVSSPEGISLHFEYDQYGNLIKTEAPEGILTEAVFDILGRVEKQFNNSDQEYLFQYDDYDNLTATIDPLGNKTRYHYDTKTNDLKAVINAKNKATNLKYDKQNRLVEEEFGGNTTNYEFDDLGYLNSYTDPNGNTFSMSYDDKKRLVSNGYAEITYDEKSNIKTVRGNDGKTIEYFYDDLNRVEKISYDGESIGYSYDKNGNLTTLTYPNNKAVLYSYDKENRLIKVQDWAGNSTTYDYLKDGRLASMTYPNNIKNIYHYDNAGRSLGFEVQKSDGTSFYSYTYVLDPTGKHIQENYDGEIDQQFQQEEASISYQYNASNRIQKAGETTFDFDANGNTIRKGNTTFSYDLWNNLTHLSSPTSEIAYTYDGLGNRRSRTENGQTTQYSLDILGMSRVLIEHLQNDQKNYYIYGLGLISRLDETDKANHYHYDFRGSTIALTDQNEAVTHSYIYDVFGETLNTTEADYNPFRFVGRYGVMQETNELYFMRARYYDAEIGRFLSEDPIWSTNLYVYSGNDPVNNSDPQGLFSIKLEYFMPVTGKDLLFNDLIDITPDPVLEAIHKALDIGGLVPGFGEPADFLNGKIYLSRGMYEDAALSFASAIPVAGYSASTIKFGKRANIHKHHSFPKFLGGKPKQELTPMLNSNHQALHKDMNDFLFTKKKNGRHMRPQRGNSGSRIRNHFSKNEIINALTEFYKGPGAKYKEAARDFFHQLRN